MNEQIQALRHDLATLAEDARALMAATTDVVGQNADQARKRLTAALAQATETCAHVRERVTQGGQAIDANVRQHPYQTIAITLAAGLVLGLLLSRKQPAPGPCSSP